VRNSEIYQTSAESEMFVKYSIIPEDVSLSWTTFAYIYTNLENNVLYSTQYCFIFSIGAFLSFYYTIVDYQLIKMFLVK